MSFTWCDWLTEVTWATCRGTRFTRRAFPVDTFTCSICEKTTEYVFFSTRSISLPFGSFPYALSNPSEVSRAYSHHFPLSSSQYQGTRGVGCCCAGTLREHRTNWPEWESSSLWWRRVICGLANVVFPYVAGDWPDELRGEWSDEARAIMSFTGSDCVRGFTFPTPIEKPFETRCTEWHSPSDVKYMHTLLRLANILHVN